MLAVAGLVRPGVAQDENLLAPQGPATPAPTLLPQTQFQGQKRSSIPTDQPTIQPTLGTALPVQTPAPTNTQNLPTDYLQVDAASVQTFEAGDTQIVQIDDPVTIRTPEATLTAASAVMWISKQQTTPLNRQNVQIALIGNATLTQGDIVRSGDRLFVSILVGGPLRFTVSDRQISDMRGTDLYRAASDIKPILPEGSDIENKVTIQRPWLDVPASQPATGPTTMPSPTAPVTFTAGDVQTTTATPDGKIAAILRGGVLLIQQRPNGDLIEMQAQECVLFTSLTNFTDLQNGAAAGMQNAVVAAYLEGDVRVNFTPSARQGRQVGEQRLRADQAYYEFATDRAILTHVVVQSKDPKLPFPITIRANRAKQLAQGEYDAQHAVITTSQFAKPSYAVNASEMYIRQHNDNDGYGQKTDYTAKNTVYRVFNVPLFYLPYAAGEMTQNAQLIRGLEIGSRKGFGFGVGTEWGLFESLGRLPPPGIDATYKLDYFSDRGPAGGFDMKYKGGLITEDTKDAWNFDGDFTSYIIQDSGQDYLGRYRANVPDDGDYNDKIRGRVMWEHQHILPDNWQLQLRAGYASDANFMEEFFEKDFNDGLPTNISAYAKRQDNTEALTFLVEFQPNSVVTQANELHNSFPGDDADPLSRHPFEVDRLPEVGYYRLGDSLADDQLTFFSENRVGGYVMDEASDPIGVFDGGPDINYGFRNSASRDRVAVPGIPSIGYTGTTGRYVARADLRQEIDWPVDVGQFKVVPYIMGRYTGWSDSPEDDPQNRILAGAGVRMTTAFWKVDDSAESDFFDIHRIRHVVEPELDLFTSAASLDRNSVYIYDETIDGVNDISAASFWIRQRWQTKRGGPGLWRSVDFLTFDVGIIGVANKPDFPESPYRSFADTQGYTADQLRNFGPLNAESWRGLYFQSTPEASQPHSALAMQGTWRLADTTLLMTDASMNLDHQTLDTAAVGLLAGRGDRVTYYTGLRYIGLINSTIASFAVQYQLTMKYSVNFSVAIDLDRTSSKGGSFSVLRKFDRFYVGAGAYYDATENTSGFTLSFFPEGLRGVNSNQLMQMQ